MGVVQPNVQPQQKCYVLGYNQGYANLSSVHYLAIKNTANKGACCNLCLRDNRCVAWTRVAGECQTLSPLHVSLHAGSRTSHVAWCKVAAPTCTGCRRSRIHHLPVQHDTTCGGSACQPLACTTRDRMCMR